MKVPEKPSAYLDRTRSDFESQQNLWKQIRVYFIRGLDKTTNERAYFYAIAHHSLHEKMMLSLNEDGNIPNFAVIVEKGYGDPTPEVKAKMKNFYGFDHDRYANDQPDNREEKD